MALKVSPDDGLLTAGTRLELLLRYAQAADGFGADPAAEGLVQRVTAVRYFDKLKPADREVLEHYASKALAGHTVGGVDFTDHDLWALEDEGELLPVNMPADGEPDPDAGPDFSDYVMVALYPDPVARDAVAGHLAGVDGSQPPQDLHVTLAYLGHVDESPDLDTLVAAARRAAAGWEELTGQLGGLGHFPAGDDGVPVWAPVDVPGLSLLRETLVDELGEDVVASDHGFTPHMTLGYDVTVDPLPPTPVTFSELVVVHGTTVVKVPLKPVGGADAEADTEGDWLGV